MYQRVGKVAYKANLDNTYLLAKYLQNPEKDFKSIHVAGTNGKGSTSHMLASVLQEAGYKVGLYTSPHLKDFRERIKINGTMISRRSVSSFITKHQDFFEKHQLSFFEMTVGLAFTYFKKQKVDVAIIEVGLGGRLDSTNIITPLLGIITNIGLDHTQFLGETLAEIAAEKAGIIKKEVPVILGEYHPETFPVFEAMADDLHAPLIKAYELNENLPQTDLQGNYQEHNVRTVVTAIQQLQKQQWAIGIQHLSKGLKHVVKNTGLLGRWQLLQEKPKVICDTAHNYEGLVYVMRQLQKEQFQHLHMVLGVVADKHLERILPLFPKSAQYYFCAAKIPRALEAATLIEKAHEFELQGSHYESVWKAYQAALKNATTEDLVFVGGSTFTVAEVL